MKHEKLYISGMTCINCQTRIASALNNRSGITEVSVSYETGTAEFSYDPEMVSLDQIITMIGDLGYEASAQNTSKKNEGCAGNHDHCGAVFSAAEMRDSEPACAEFSGGQRDGVWDVVCDRTDHFRSLYCYVRRNQLVADTTERYVDRNLKGHVP